MVPLEQALLGGGQDGGDHQLCNRNRPQHLRGGGTLAEAQQSKQPLSGFGICSLDGRIEGHLELGGVTVLFGLWFTVSHAHVPFSKAREHPNREKNVGREA